MRLGYHRRRVTDVAAGLRQARAGAHRERFTRERLERFQRERLAALVRHAARHSPYYRERLAGVADGRVHLEQLPTITKAEMMERFDDLVCDPMLRRDALLEWVEALDDDRLHPGGYRVMTTSGSSGRKGLFVYDRDGWRGIASQWLRHSAMASTQPRVPRLRFATISGAAPTHMSRQGAATLSVGVHRMLALPVTLPLDRMVAALNRFAPQALYAYPSAAMLLAEEQLAGRLRLELGVLITGSELRTPAMTERLAEAFGVAPFDLYATTEGLWASECEHHDGLHVFEDMALFENVDADGRPVPPGTPGARVLVTNLCNRVQPIIRLELEDVITIEPEPCPCGRTLRRMRAVEGRTEDALALPGRAGDPVTVLPAQFSVVTRDREVGEFQVVQEGPRLRILVVPRPSASRELEARLGAAVADRLNELGVDHPQVVVERRQALARSVGGKLPLVVADR
jgi:phenylacetate-coenzyme A ligase PaaK-like adenylate-forming protein